jgi:hypothetical protein
MHYSSWDGGIVTHGVDIKNRGGKTSGVFRLFGHNMNTTECRSAMV